MNSRVQCVHVYLNEQDLFKIKKIVGRNKKFKSISEFVRRSVQEFLKENAD